MIAVLRWLGLGRKPRVHLAQPGNSPVGVAAPHLNGSSFVMVGRRPVQVAARTTTPYARGRALDWFLALSMAAMALWLTLPGAPSSIQIGTPGSWAAGLSKDSWTFVLIALAGIRAASILINGHWRSGASALIRGGAACIGAVFWSQILYYLVYAALLTGRPNIVIIWFGSLFVGDFYCAIRAALDFVVIRAANRDFSRLGQARNPSGPTGNNPGWR